MMRRLFIVAVILGSILPFASFAGNNDRVGSSGASELLINPWVRTPGWASAGLSSVIGIEATFLNVAGLAYIGKTDVLVSRTNWLSGSETSINALGFGQRIGEKSVLGISVMNMNFGEIEITTTELPEGGIGTFSPNYTVFGISYAKLFSERISGGFQFKLISETIANAKAQGAAFDAGIRYVTGKEDRIKFGISLKNIGPAMTYSGDGFSVNAFLPESEKDITTEQRVSSFEMPSLFSIGLSYDIKVKDSKRHLITPAATFVSNSFSKDQFHFGLQYSVRTLVAKLSLRGGYMQIGKDDLNQNVTVLTGPTGGASLEFGSLSKGTSISVDYAYQATNSFNGIHSLGIFINVK